MNLLEWFLLILTIIIFIYIVQKNLQNFQFWNSFAEKEEGFGADEDDIKSIRIKTPVSLNSFPVKQNQNMLLKDCVVKSSYNTAYTGSKMSLDAITYALIRGYRFIDLEVYLVDNLPVVGYGKNPATNIITSSNTVPFGQALYNIVTGAFTAPSPNMNDPVFIHLRIKSLDNSIYELIAKSIDNNLKARLFVGRVDGYTPISDLMNKIVIVVDKKIAPKYADSPDCSTGDSNQKCFNLKNYVNMESNSDDLRTYKHNMLLDTPPIRPVIMDDKTTDITVLKMSYPDIEGTTTANVNPNASLLQKDYGVNFVMMQLYLVDSTLKEHEQLFDEKQMGICPFYKIVG